MVSDEQMEKMGEEAFAELKQKQKISNDANVTSYVSCVARSITEKLPDRRDWEIVVFEEESANAFALPGGKIGVHTGLLKVAKSPAQLATVLGHEVAHVLAEHSKERVSQTLAAQGGLTVLNVILGNKNDSRRYILMGALGLAQFGYLLPHSRAQETEADILGLDFMARSGYNPQESIGLWENMASAGGGQAPEFLSTHPSHGTRIENLQAKIPQATALYQQANERPNCAP
jgi:predicted Zn-dependent protease